MREESMKKLTTKLFLDTGEREQEMMRDGYLFFNGSEALRLHGGERWWEVKEEVKNT